MSDGKNINIGGRFLGFLTVMLILTLNASNGKDMLDVIVPWIESQTVSTLENSTGIR